VKVEEEALGSEGAADIKKVKPLVSMPDTQTYYGIGDFIAKAFAVGQSLRKPGPTI